MAELWKPHPYQRQAVQWVIEHPAAGLFLDPGLGKTSIALAAFQLLREAGAVDAAIVVAPKRVCEMVWTHHDGGELSRWEQFGDLREVFLHGPHKGERLAQAADLYVLNFEGLPWLCEGGRLRDLTKSRRTMLIVDELSKLKHAKTQRFKAIKPHLDRFVRRVGLTGSPAANGLIDLFGQLYVLDQGARLGRYVTHYRRAYFFPTGYGGYTWELQEGGEERIYDRIGDIVLSMHAVDHLKLPKLTVQDLYVQLPPKARKVYDELEEDFIAAIDGDVVTAANAAVVGGKCRQVASGGVYIDDEILSPRQAIRRVKEVHREKVDALVELVDELQGSPLLVAYEYAHDLARIRKVLGKDVPAINGSTTTKQGRRIVAEWNAGKIPVLCGHPAAMAHGLNLQAAGSHVCWFSLTWDLEKYDQLIRRVWRQGNKSKRVVVHRIIARKTVDEAVALALIKKSRTQSALMSALKRYRRSLSVD